MRIFGAVALAVLFLGGTATLLPAQDKKPIVVGLSEKAKMPDLKLKTSLGDDFKLRPALMGKWTVLFYFRGKWCPYGRWQIKELRTIENDLLTENVDVMGISPEGFTTTNSMAQEFQTGFVLLSDENFDAALNMGLMESIPLKDSDNYRIVGARLMELPSGGYIMPRSAVWLINPDGVVAFAHLPVDPKNILKGPELIQIIRQEMAKAKVETP